MSHWYKDNARFTSNHKDWPKNKDGTPTKVAKKKDMIAAGAVLGVTSVLANFENSFWMPKYFGQIGAECGLESPDLDSAMKLFWQRRNKPADEGTDIHQIISDYLVDGKTSDDERAEPLYYEIDNLLARLEIYDDYKAETCFTYNKDSYAYGGTIDLESENIVLDWKTCDDGRRPYWKECAQLAAYDQGKGRKLIDVYIHRRTWNIVNIKEWTPEQSELGWKLFKLNYDANEILGMKL